MLAKTVAHTSNGPKQDPTIHTTNECCEGGTRLNSRALTTQPLISIITVTYNAVATLEDSIRSVLQKKSPRIEYIIIDGGSNDGTIDILTKYSNYIDYWKSESDRGIYNAMNKGLHLAKGEYVLFLGADDFLLNIPDFHLFTVDLLLGEVSCGTWLVKPPKGPNLSNKMKYRNVIHPQGTFYKNANIYYNEKYRVCADYLFNIEHLFAARSVGYTDSVISKFSIDGASSRWTAKLEIIKISFKTHGLLASFKSILYHLVSQALTYKYNASAHGQ